MKALCTRKKYIGQLLVGLGIMCIGTTLSALPGDVANAIQSGCSVVSGQLRYNGIENGVNTQFGITLPPGGTTRLGFVNNQPTLPTYAFASYSTTEPTLPFTQPVNVSDTQNEIPVTGSVPETRYVILGGSLENEICIFSYEFTSDGQRTGEALVNGATPTPVDVPIFTPLGILATISGLLWFGRRRKAMKVNT